MENNLLTTYASYLEEHGYILDKKYIQDYIQNGCIEDIRDCIFEHNVTGATINLGINLTTEDDDWFDDESDEDNQPSDFVMEDYEVNSAYFFHPGNSSYFDESEAWARLVDSIDYQYYSDYEQHLLEDFEKCVWISLNPLQHQADIYQMHSDNVKTIINEYLPILKKYDFELDVRNKYEEDGQFSLEFIQQSDASESIRFQTDPLSGILTINHDKLIIPPKDFEKFILTNYCTDQRTNKIRLEYKYLFDTKYHKKTSQNFYALQQILSDARRDTGPRRYGVRLARDVDFSTLEAKEFFPFVLEGKELMQEHYQHILMQKRRKIFHV